MTNHTDQHEHREWYETAEQRRLGLSEALGLGTGAPWDAIRERAAELAAASPVRAPDTDRTAVLSQTERDMLRYALDLAQDQIHSRGDEFTDEDQAAVDSLRRLAGGSAGRVADDTQPETHSCRNCGGVDPDTCLMNPDRTCDPEPARHLGGKANAEDCTGCKSERRNLPYPFLCPGPDDAPAVGGAQQPQEEA